MTIATRLKAYLEQQTATYELVPHHRTQSSLDSAAAAHVPSGQIAKAVIVKENDAYLMVVVPSDHHVHLGLLHRHLGNEVGLATEAELVKIFPDCDEGAIPPVGAAYGVRTLIDNSLLNLPTVYFESGDHLNLVKLTGEQFVSLLDYAERVNVGKHL